MGKGGRGKSRGREADSSSSSSFPLVWKYIRVVSVAPESVMYCIRESLGAGIFFPYYFLVLYFKRSFFCFVVANSLFHKIFSSRYDNV